MNHKDFYEDSNDENKLKVQVKNDNTVEKKDSTNEEIALEEDPLRVAIRKGKQRNRPKKL